MRRYLPIIAITVLSSITPALQAQVSLQKTATAPAQSREETTQTTAKEPDVIFVPTPQRVVDRMLEEAQIKPGDVLYDLGCGDGRIVVTAAKKYGVKAMGFDVDPQRIKESRENVRRNNVEHLVTIQQADIFTLDLSKADVVTLYLLPSLNVKLIPQLQRMKPGSRVVSHSFNMAGTKPEAVIEHDNHTIYKWTIPLQQKETPDRAESR